MRLLERKKSYKTRACDSIKVLLSLILLGSTSSLPAEATPIQQRFKGWLETKIKHPTSWQRLQPVYKQIEMHDPSTRLQIFEGMSAPHMGLQLYAVTFEADNIPLCNHENKAVEFADGSRFILGEPLPLTSQDTPTPSTWPERDKVFARVKQAIGRYDRSTAALDKELINSQRCWLVLAGKPVAGWEMVVRPQGSLSYLVYANAKVVTKIERLAFDAVTGKVQAYTHNAIDGGLSQFELPLVGNNKLESDQFVTIIENQEDTSFTQAEESSHEFIYDPSDERFSEASIFANAHRMLDYFKSLGYTWEEPDPIKLVVHAVLGGTSNNALYEPSTGSPNTHYPRISIGDGDGVTLQNLATDRDVVAHEFGHHIIFRYLKQTTGESLVLHEGLADYFVFAQTEDTCLGESICPADSNICTKPSQCLRSADVSTQYGDDVYRSSPPHRRGQVISATLWDLRSSLGGDTVNRLVFKALPFLTKTAGFEELIIAMLLSDKEHYGSQHGCTVLAAFNQRGFTSFTSHLDCNDESTWEMSSGLVSTEVTRTTKDDDGFGVECGSSFPPTSTGDKPSRFPYGYWVLLCIPCLLAATLQHRRQRQQRNQGY
ncbi:MAG: hypothetical protein OXT67_00720 [Zetaproteobacteria bacterium]|nr:hypothetical protein [Zetaproteobacteria bacterium]